MRNITFSADDSLVEAARATARQKKTTLNAEFRKWLQQYANTNGKAQQRVQAYRQLMGEMSGVSSAGHKLTRDQMNERRSPEASA